MLIAALIIWDVVWKLIALWKAGGSKQLVWFIVLGVLNTVGLLPIVYLLFFQKKHAAITTKTA
jgi:hypothetical protein